DDYKPNGTSNFGTPTACGGSGGSNIYVAGTLNENNSRYWVVRQGTNAGAGWQNVDTFVITNDAYGPIAIGYGVSGKLYVTGSLPHGNGNWYWDTRRGSATGLSWVESDQYEPTAGGVTSNAMDYAYVSSLGSFVVGTANGNGIVRVRKP